MMDKLQENQFDQRFSPNELMTKEYIAPQALLHAKRVKFQETMKRTILTGQFFGLMPVLGFYQSDVKKQRFTVFSWRYLYTICSIIVQCGVVCFSILKLFVGGDGSAFFSSITVVYSILNTITTILFLKIAKKWPKLSLHISEIERVFPNTDYSVIRRCNLTCAIVLSLALLEHILADLSSILTAIECEPDKDLFEAFITRSFPYIFTFVTYSPFTGLLSQFSNIQMTFNWSFSNVFVICISWYLTSRLNQVNKTIRHGVKGQMNPSSFWWRTVREDYTRITDLVKDVDSIISGVVFISFTNNLFFICTQLLHILQDGIRPMPMCQKSSVDVIPLKGYGPAIYFLYSFAFLLGRSMALSLIAAKVHTASCEPAQMLYNVPPSSYCEEVQRLSDQIRNDTVALTGLNFFNVKRGLVLTVAGTIVTYELVLMQFAGAISPSALAASNYTLSKANK